MKHHIFFEGGRLNLFQEPPTRRCRDHSQPRYKMAATKILEAHRKSFVSQRALAEILQLLPEEEDQPATSRATLKRKRDDKMNLTTPYGPLWKELTGFTMKEGPPLKVSYIDPLALLWHACNQGGGFQEFLQNCAARNPCSPAHPWDICLYVDEVSPGNQLKPVNERKLQVLYFSLKQFGGLALSKEDSWFVLTAVRSTDVKRLSNGMTQLMKRYAYCRDDFLFVYIYGTCVQDIYMYVSIYRGGVCICSWTYIHACTHKVSWPLYIYM